MFTLCEAELTFTDKQNFTLHTKETIPLDPPVLYREMTARRQDHPGRGIEVYLARNMDGTELGDHGTGANTLCRSCYTSREPTRGMSFSVRELIRAP